MRRSFSAFDYFLYGIAGVILIIRFFTRKLGHKKKLVLGINIGLIVVGFGLIFSVLSIFSVALGVALAVLGAYQIFAKDEQEEQE